MVATTSRAITGNKLTANILKRIGLRMDKPVFIFRLTEHIQGEAFKKCLTAQYLNSLRFINTPWGKWVRTSIFRQNSDPPLPFQSFLK
jgi:hypothetical protein